MATGYQGAEPPSKFCEVVRVGRLQGGRRIEPHEVTVFYKYKSGRAEFEVQGGTLFDLERSGRQCRLRIVTSNGQKLSFVRNAGGGYEFTENSQQRFWGDILERVHYQ